MPTIFYDATCGLCTGTIGRWQKTLQRAGFALEPLQGDHARSVLHFSGNAIPDEMKLQTTQGDILGGVDALLHIARRIWWCWPIWMVAQVPGVKGIFGMIYRRIARRRHKLSGVCQIRP